MKHILCGSALLIGSLVATVTCAATVEFYCPAYVIVNGNYVTPQTGNATVLNSFGVPSIKPGITTAGIATVYFTGAMINANFSSIQTFCNYQNPKTGLSVSLQNIPALFAPSSLANTQWVSINPPGDQPLYQCESTQPEQCPFVAH